MDKTAHSWLAEWWSQRVKNLVRRGLSRIGKGVSTSLEEFGHQTRIAAPSC